MKHPSNPNEKLALVVHGGAGPDSDYIKENTEKYEEGIREAVERGYKILEEGGSAVDAAEAAVKVLEDNPLFNAGRGSALNADAEVEMDAAIMDGEKQKSGAVAMVRNVRNPISLAKAVMLNTSYRFLGDMGALEYAKKIDIKLEPDSYFITEHQFDAYSKERDKEFTSTDSVAMDQVNQRLHGTVGAVALDKDGKLAAATSTGGIENKKPGRIGDSCIIGVGCYANKKTAALSGTGDGEILMKNVLCYDISALMEYKNMSLTEACNEVILNRIKKEEGDVGVIGVDSDGNIALVFNCARMHRGWRTSSLKTEVHIYQPPKPEARKTAAKAVKATTEKQTRKKRK